VAGAIAHTVSVIHIEAEVVGYTAAAVNTVAEVVTHTVAEVVGHTAAEVEVGHTEAEVGFIRVTVIVKRLVQDDLNISTKPGFSLI
jgi:hypothetical protein